ncbi:MAG: ABC transporter permease [Candidatus Acidiferrales bacterium]
MNTLCADIRYALRGFRQTPGFITVVALSLAIGIGACTSLFSIANALLLRPLPYSDEDRLVILWNRSPGLNITQDWFSTAQYFDIKNGHRGLEQVAIAIGGNENLTGNGDPERVGAIHISSNLLPMLGEKAALGRLFVADEDVQGVAPTALLSYGMWTRRYGSDPQIIGKFIQVNGVSREVVGVLPKSFSLPREVLPTLGGAEQADILLPLPLAPDAARNRDREDYNIIGKLRRGVSARQAQAEMDTITARLRHDHPDVYPPNGGLTFGVVPLLEQVVRDARYSLFVLLGAVGFVLLIACANVANLQLSRAVSRQKEIAVRVALGASRGRILRQLFTESVLLALGGGALGILFSFVCVHWVHVLGPKSVPRLASIGVDGEALLFTGALCVFSGILFGLAPAWRATQIDLHSTLKDAGRGSAGAGSVWGRGRNLRRMLVISEMALSVVLLIGAGLLIRSFARLLHVSPGFNPENVLTVELTMSGPKYDSAATILATYHLLWQRLEALPGVTAAGAVTSLPLSDMFAWGPIVIEGRTPPAGENFINADQRIAGGDYFQAMQIPLRSGRFFNEQDTTTNPPVAIIDEFMAREYWPREDPLGKRFRFGGLDADGKWITIVGVVGRIKQYTLDTDSRIALYLPQTQYPARSMNVVLRSRTNPIALAPAVGDAIHSIDSDLPLYNVRTMQQRLNESLARRKFSMLLLTGFAAFALALATIGVYGVIAYLVNQGTRELGIRIALGASPRNVLALVVRQGMSLALTGVAIGVAGALALTNVMQSLLFGVKATDALTFAAIPLLLTVIVLLTSLVPARRAARIDPMISLRSE